MISLKILLVVVGVRNENAKDAMRLVFEKMSVSTASAVVKATATAAKVMAETASSIMWNKSGVKHVTMLTYLSLFMFFNLVYLSSV